jgi:putative flippase GtrA
MRQKIPKFFLVGLFNTCVNFVLILFLTGYFGINIILSSTFSFILSNLLSFIINSKFVFYQEINIYFYFRFLTASILSFLITIGLNSLFYILDFHYILATIMCIFTIPFLTFLIHHKWTWKS